MRNIKTSDYKAALGLRIRSLRESQEVSLRKFALMVGVDYSYLSNVERGKANVSIDTLAKIADGLGVELRDLF